MILDSLGEIQRYGTVLENREQKQESYIVSGECSERIVKKYNLKLYTQGWCHIVPLAPTKDNGYIQVSFRPLDTQ